MIKEKVKLKIAYQNLKDRFEKLNEKKFNKHEQFELLEMFVDSIRNTSIEIDVFVLIIIMTSSKLFHSLIFIDEKNLSIEN
jgi:hypothetical protein